MFIPKYLSYSICFLCLWLGLNLQAQCPTYSTCQNGVLRLHFSPPITYNQNTPYTFCFGESDYRNGTFNPLPQNVIGLPGTPTGLTGYLDFAIFCDGTELYSLTMPAPYGGTINCVFSGGEYCATCPPVSCGQNTDNCMLRVNGCEADLITFVENLVADEQCQQWEGACDANGPIFRSGQVSIGSTQNGPMGLNVKAGIIAEKIKIEECNVMGWCDYVFAEDYPLVPLNSVAQFIRTNGHLPGIPSAQEVVEAGGFELGDMTLRYQEKIEEVFLYLIDLKTEADALEAELEMLLAENERLINTLSE